jgi:hypothetical protein
MVVLLNNLADVTIAHNTMAFNFDNGLFAMIETYPAGSAHNIDITDNVVTKARDYAIIHSGTKVGIESMKAYAGTQWKVARNVIVGVGREYVPWHPAGNFYPASMDEVGFVDWRGGDYRIKGGSQFAGRAAKATNPGVDFGLLQAATANVIVNPTGRQARDSTRSR